MTGNAQTFREGATWYRNSMDLAKEYRDTAIARANEIARGGYGEASDPSLGAPREPQSQGTSTEDEVYFTSHSTQDSETSIDEPALDTSLSRKRSSRSRPSRPRKRATASSGAGGSIASDSWTFAGGVFRRFQGSTEVSSQEDHPRDVWVYRADGWGSGMQWCFYRTDGTAQYR